MAFLKVNGVQRAIMHAFLKVGGVQRRVKQLWYKYNGVVKGDILLFHSGWTMGYMEGSGVNYYGFMNQAPFVFGSIDDKACLTTQYGSQIVVQQCYHERKPSVPRYAFYFWTNGSPYNSYDLWITDSSGNSINFTVTRQGDIVGRFYADISIAHSDWIVARKGQAATVAAYPI